MHRSDAETDAVLAVSTGDVASHRIEHACRLVAATYTQSWNPGVSFVLPSIAGPTYAAVGVAVYR